MHLEQAEENPDVTLTLTNGKKIVVREGIDEVVGKVESHWRRVFSPSKSRASLEGGGGE